MPVAKTATAETTETSNVAVDATPKTTPAKKNRAAKKPAPKAAKTTPAADTASKAEKKAPAKPKAEQATKKTQPAAEKIETAKATPAKKDGLRKAQVRLLVALTGPMTRADWAKATNTDNAACTEYIGSLNDEVRAKNDEKHFPSLITLKLVKVKIEDIDGKNVAVYDTTAKGKKEQEKLASSV